MTSIKRVLLIDDNEIDLKINAKLISLSGFSNDIIVCKSGEEGINFLKKNIGEPANWPDFILLDIQMPEMDGFEFLEIYRQLPENLLANCKLAILSSTLDFGDIMKAEANPLVLKLFKKPLNLTEFKEVLNNTYMNSLNS